MSSIQDNLFLITGGSRGLGRSMALHLAERGADVIITFQSREDAAQEVVAAVEALGRRAVALRLDVGRSADFPAFFAEVATVVRERLGRDGLDGLVNNAGMGLHASFADTTEAQLDALFAVHFKAPFLITQGLLPVLKDGARVLNISSGLARFSFPGYAAYGAMKAGIEALTRYQARELGGRGIRVNVLAPGAIATDFGGGALRDNPAMRQAIGQQAALGRVGEADDIGAAALMLLSPESGWVTGQRVEASGGMLL